MKSAAATIIALLVLCLPADVLAIRLGPLLLGNPAQKIDLSYRYDSIKTESRSSTQQHMYEDYSFKMDYAVYKPQLLSGQFSLGLRTDQSIISGNDNSSSNGWGITYDIDGNFLKKTTTPLNFLVQSKIEEIPGNFGAGYENKSDTYALGFSIHNKYLPVTVRYSETTNETSGLLNDRVQNHDVLSLVARHGYKKLSTTNLTLIGYHDRSTDEAGTEKTSARNNDISAENILSWGKSSGDHSLRSFYRLVSQTGDNDYLTWNWSESLQSNLGSALRLGANYSYDNRSILLRKSQTNSGRAWIQHRLFNNLTTRLDAQGRRETSLTGVAQDVSGRAGISYYRNLSPLTKLNVDVFESYGVTDRNIINSIEQIFEEPHLIDQFQINYFIVLANQSVVPESIVVRNQDPLRRPTEYTPGIDFIYDVIGGQKGIRLIGNDFRDNDTLLITYDFATNPLITYDTDTKGIATSLTTAGGKYRYYASWRGTKQKLLSGRADQVNLVADANDYVLGFEDQFTAGSFTSEYNRSDSDTDNNQSLRATLRHRGQIGGGRYSLYLADTFSQSETNINTPGVAATTRTENILNTGGNYIRNVFSTALFTATTDYSHVTGDEPRDDLSAGADLAWHYGKLTVTLRTQLILRSYQGFVRQEERVRFNLTRYF